MFSSGDDNGGIWAGALLLSAIFCPLLQANEDWGILSSLFMFAICAVFLGGLNRLGYAIWKVYINENTTLAIKILRWSIYVMIILAVEYYLLKWR